MKKQTVLEENVWQSNQQLLRVVLGEMVNKNDVPKLEVVADSVGMSQNEFFNKISMHPRTPLTLDERIQVEHFIFEKSQSAYLNYLRRFHLNESICVED